MVAYNTVAPKKNKSILKKLRKNNERQEAMSNKLRVHENEIETKTERDNMSFYNIINY